MDNNYENGEKKKLTFNSQLEDLEDINMREVKNRDIRTRQILCNTHSVDRRTQKLSLVTLNKTKMARYIISIFKKSAFDWQKSKNVSWFMKG